MKKNEKSCMSVAGKMSRTGSDYIKQNEPESESEILSFLSCSKQNSKRKENHKLVE